MIHLTEAVASRRSGKYTKYVSPFPDKPDKDDIIQFLEDNGFKDIGSPISDYSLLELVKKKNVKYYSVGEHDSEPIKHYVKWCDPKKDIVYFVRTISLDKLSKSIYSDNRLYHIMYLGNRCIRTTNNWEEFVRLAKKEMES